jgi:predicted phage terminase large subunit-like protein
MPSRQPTPAEIQEALRINIQECQDNLKFLCMKFLRTPHWGHVHDELKRFLMTAGNRIHIELPRGHLKSWIVTKGWAIQQVLRNPNLRILIVNATEDNAVKFMRTIEAFLSKNGLLSDLFGQFESAVWNQNECVIRQRTEVLDAPTFMAAGLQKTLTSQHFDIIIADDLVEPDNVRTKEQREKVYDFYLSLFDLLEPTGKIVVIGTRYHQDDLYSKILEENLEHKNWSVFVRSCYNPDGSILFPQKFTQAQLDDIKKKSFYHFSTQYLNDPIDPENADFKSDQIKYYEPGTQNPSSLYLTVDPAISLSRDADFTAMVVAGMFSDRRIRVVDYSHKRLVPDALVDEVFALVKKWKLHRVGIETFAFQKTLKYEIQRRQRETGIFFSIDELGKRHTGRGEQILSKEARIRRLQPYFEQGLVEIGRTMSELRDELLSFPRGRHDDLIDALSYQLDYLVPSIGKGPAKVDDYKKDANGILKPTGAWWNKQLVEPSSTLYERFMQDLK